MKTTKKGFTLVELLVVIAILAILATVSVVGYTTFIQKANRSVDQQAVTQMNIVLQADAIVNGVPQGIDQVKDLLEANGYSDELTPIYDGYIFGWYPEANVMVLIDKKANKVDYPEEYRDVDVSKIQPCLLDATYVYNEEDAISYINTGAITGGYVQLAEGNYPKLGYGLDMGEIVKQVGTEENDWPIYEKLNKIGSLTIGGAGAKIDGFSISSTTAEHPAVNNDGKYYIAQRHEIQTLKFEDVTFTNKVNISLGQGSTIQNLVFEDVTFDLGDKSVDTAVLSIKDASGTVFSNITLKNCKFENCKSVDRAIQLYFPDKTTAANITITGCTFTGNGPTTEEFNTIQFSASEFTGKIVITNNTISNSSGRAIRIPNVAGQLVITNNTITDCADGNGEVIKYDGTPTSVELGNNTHNGNDIVWSQVSESQVSDVWVATEKTNQNQ